MQLNNVSANVSSTYPIVNITIGFRLHANVLFLNIYVYWSVNNEQDSKEEKRRGEINGVCDCVRVSVRVSVRMIV
jgi:hypothetical protein